MQIWTLNAAGADKAHRTLIAAGADKAHSNLTGRPQCRTLVFSSDSTARAPGRAPSCSATSRVAATPLALSRRASRSRRCRLGLSALHCQVR